MIGIKKDNKEKVLATHVILNYPNTEIANLVVDILVANGSKFIELQIPFSDPIADGAVISQACGVSIQNGFNLQNAFQQAKIYTEKYKDVKFVFVAYANSIFNFGIKEFCLKSKESGLSGIIVPDLPFDSQEGKVCIEECLKNNLNYIPVVSPNMKIDRISKIEKVYNPKYVYATAISGITGSTKSDNNILEKYIKTLREIFTESYIILGFGIKTPADISEILHLIDLPVVGTAIVKIITENYKNKEEFKNVLSNFILSLQNVLKA
jgi:tryptophan synthase alpha chain